MDYSEKPKHGRRYRSLFWPMLFIGVGTTWLLFNIGVFNDKNIATLFQLWPLLLVGIGLDLLFGRTSPTRGATIGLAFVGFVLAIMYVGPSIGLGQITERNQTQFEIPLDGSKSLELNINAGIDNVVLNPLIDSNNLVEANVWHFGELVVEDKSDEDTKVLTVEQEDFSFNFSFSHDVPEQNGWVFFVNPDVPLAIDFNGGIGETDVDLRPFTLTDLKFDMGVGEIYIQLPIPTQDYVVDISGGIGEVRLDIPDDVAVKVEASTGVGEVDIPPGFVLVDGDDSFLGGDGIWQTEDFDNAEHKIFVMFDGGVGSLVIR